MKYTLLEHFMLKTPLPGTIKKSKLWIAFKKYDTLFREGEAAQKVYLLYQGKVQLIKKHSDQQQYLISTLTSGSTIGMPAVLAQSVYTSTAVAITLVRACPIEQEVLLQFLRQHPQYYQKLAENLAQTVLHYEKIIGLPPW